MLESMQQLFPQCKVTDDEIIWNRETAKRGHGAVVYGYRGDDIMIDGCLSPDQLAALANWARLPVEVE